MKPLLYIGAALMTGAGIYGFVDYKQKEHSREFKSLYIEQKKIQGPPPAPVAPAVVTAPAVKEKKEMVFEDEKRVAATKEVVKKNKIISGEQFSRAALEKEEIILIEPEIKLEQ